jgi:hypothetical protein
VADQGITKGEPDPDGPEKYVLPDAETPGSAAITDIPAPGGDVSDADPDSEPGIRKAQELGADYQRAGQIRQALSEHRNATRHGNEERQKAARKNLEALGFEGDIFDDEDKTPRGRQTREQRMTKSDTPAAKETGPSVSRYSTSTPAKSEPSKTDTSKR